MAMLDDLEALQESDPRNRKYDVWLEALSPRDQEAFSEALKNPRLSTTALMAVAKSHGATFTQQTLARHRKTV